MSKFPAHKEGLEALADKVDLSPVEQNGQVIVVAEDLGRALGYANPAHAVHKLYRHYESELKHYSVETESVSTDGKAYPTRGYTLEGALMLSMFARTNNAKRVRAWLARVGQERMERMHQAVLEAQTQALELTEGARREALAQGARMAMRLGPARRRRMRRATAYRAKGLSIGDIAKLLDSNNREVHYLLKTAQVLEPKRLGA